MATRTSGGAPAPARIFRWEPYTAVHADIEGWVLCRDDDRAPAEAWEARCMRSTRRPHWFWLARNGRCGWAPDEDAARRACLLAVLHADSHEPGGWGDDGA